MEKVKKKIKLSGNRVINLYLSGISQMVKIKDIKKLQQDIENNPIIRDQTANLGCLSVCTFCNFLVSVLVAAHTINNLDLRNDKRFEDEGYKSN